ncbi:MAG: flagellar basal-body MS-ring/collar protein FliF [Sulfuricurvum sp.]
MDFKALFLQLSSLFAKLTKQQRIIITSAVVGIVGFLVFLIIYSQKKDASQNYEKLFDALSSEDAAKVVEQLEKDKIPYEVSGNNVIRVPKEALYKQRIAIASMGIPKNRGVGFELFDKQEFGATAFDQNVKYIRALEGELTRTIESLEPIQSATVSLAIPKESLFIEKKLKPSASIVVHLRDGSSLNSKQIRGIKNLVASSVADLDVVAVNITDSLGITLGDEDEMAQMGDLSNTQLSYKAKEEAKLQRKIVEMISPFVGGDESVVAQVTMEFDFSQQSITSEKFDPESVVRSEQTSEEKREGSSPAQIGGIPGAVSNIGPVEGLEDNSANKERYEKSTGTTNYEIGKTVSTIKSEFARLKRITAAVVVDGKYKRHIDTEGKANGELEYVALSESELDALESLVSRSIGLNEARGDQVSVKNLQFKTPSLDANEQRVAKAIDFSKRYIEPFSDILKYLVSLIVLYVLYKKVIAPFAQKMLEDTKEEDEHGEALIDFGLDEDQEDLVQKAQAVRKRVEDQLGVGEGFNEDELKYDVIIDKLRHMVEESPDSMAHLLQALLSESGDSNNRSS